MEIHKPKPWRGFACRQRLIDPSLEALKMGHHYVTETLEPPNLSTPWLRKKVGVRA